MHAVILAGIGLGAFVAAFSCVPTGNAPPYDAGATTSNAPTFKPSLQIMTAPFDDDFERGDAADGTWPGLADGGDTAKRAAAPRLEAGAMADGESNASVLAELLREAGAAEAGPPARPSNLGPNWFQSKTSAWRVENGRLCGQNAKNHGVWLNRVLPVNARIEFDAIAETNDGDLKTEVWGDGQSSATGVSYTNATSYLAILGGWKNTLHVLARINEHGTDRKVIAIDKESDDPRQRAVVKGQVYRFRVERNDGKTVRWSVDGVEYLTFVDASPLAGQGHDHFGFNEWEAKVCYDNVKVTPLL